jgi:hypothetical protein
MTTNKRLTAKTILGAAFAGALGLVMLITAGAQAHDWGYGGHFHYTPHYHAPVYHAPAYRLPVYHAPSIHIDRTYHVDSYHYTPHEGLHTHGHYHYTPHYTPGHFHY